MRTARLGGLSIDPARVVDVPLLRAGRHPNPRRGACLLELASVVQGGRWTDRPDTVEPTLAQLGRLVNDLSSDAGRRALLPLLPGLLGTRPDQASAASVARAVRQTCARVAESSPRQSVPRVAVAGRWRSLVSGWHRDWVCRRQLTSHVRAVAGRQPPGARRDAALRQVLLDAIVATRQAQGAGGFVPVDPAGSLPQAITLLTWSTAPRYGEGEWTFECSPVHPDQVRLLLGQAPGQAAAGVAAGASAGHTPWKRRGPAQTDGVLVAQRLGRLLVGELGLEELLGQQGRHERRQDHHGDELGVLGVADAVVSQAVQRGNRPEPQTRSPSAAWCERGRDVRAGRRPQSARPPPAWSPSSRRTAGR